MNKKILILFIIIALVLGVIAAFVLSGESTPQIKEPEEIDTGPMYATYIIEGQEIALVNGFKKEQIPGFMTMRTTQVFQGPFWGDIDGDQDEDAVLTIVQSVEGGAPSYYLALALRQGETYQGTEALFLGDRVEPQALHIKNGMIVLQYIDTLENASATQKTTYVKYEEGALKDAKIFIETPEVGAAIQSPLVVKGWARGVWFFEASFPLVLVNWDGLIIAQGVASAKDEWMTQEYVPFEGTLTFDSPEYIGDFSKRGALILQKDNPSGLPEFDDAVEISIQFAQ